MARKAAIKPAMATELITDELNDIERFKPAYSLIDPQEKVRVLQKNPQFGGIGEENLKRVVNQMQNDDESPAFIIATSKRRPVSRRVRVPWEAWEVE